jgi:hypothetical protein
MLKYYLSKVLKVLGEEVLGEENCRGSTAEWFHAKVA